VQRLKRISTYHLGDFEVVVEMLSVVGFGSSLGSISMEEYRELQICARLAKLKGAIPDMASSEVRDLRSAQYPRYHVTALPLESWLELFISNSTFYISCLLFLSLLHSMCMSYISRFDI